MIFRNWVLQNFPFLEDDFDALTDYELFCKMVEYMKKSLEKVDGFQKDIDAFTIKLNEFQHWFDNLDVQDEINAKLDEMALDGTLENLIGQYIQLATTYVYNNVDDMLDAENLVDGSFARTSGFYSYNDGGGAYYKIREITNIDIIDDITLFALNNSETLVAELIINDEMNIKQFGAVDDNTTDNSDIFNKVATLNIKKINYYGDTFKISETIDFLDKENIELNFNCKIHIASSNDAGTSCFRILRCKDIKINGYYVYSERDKTENPQGTSTRVSSYGSNIYGLVLRSCENIYINNIYFENMANDIVISKYDLDNLEEYPNTKKVYIENYVSLNASQNNLLAYCENIYYNNVDLTPALDMGSGDHCWYFVTDVENVNINNLNVNARDDYFNIIFQCNVGDNAGYVPSKNIKVNNANIVASGILYIDKNSDVTFNNLNYYDNETGNTHTYLISIGADTNVVFNNSIFKNLRKAFLTGNSNLGLTINNSDITTRNGNTGAIFNFSGGTINFKLINSNIYNSNGLVYYSGGSVSGNALISNCYVEKISASCIGKRSTTINLVINNTRFINNGSNIAHFADNGSADATGLSMLYVYIKGFNNLMYPNTTGLIALSSYLNNTLIS